MASCQSCIFSLQAAMFKMQLRAVGSSLFCASSSSRASPQTSKYLRALEYFLLAAVQFWDLKKLLPIFLTSSATDKMLSTSLKLTSESSGKSG
uniref:Uncharacterized protein n=1 Tax=Anguilla anguilla TaxID=7936 RepID=A0A0E9WX33_ANGAN